MNDFAGQSFGIKARFEDKTVDLDPKIARFARRLRLLEFLDRLAVGLLAALGIAALVVGTDRLVYLGTDARAVGSVCALAGAAWAAVGVAFRKPVTRLDAAVRADRALRLGDRLPSAIQLQEQDGPWAFAVASDAAQRVGPVAPATVFPYKATWPARLLVPAAIMFGLVSVAPSADLLGRMRREVRRRVAAETEARSAANALAAASRRLSSGSGTESIGGLRLTLVRIEKNLLGGLDDARRAELAADLRRLAALLGEERAGRQLAERIQSTADAIAKADKEAARMLHGAQEELARLEEMLTATDALSPEMQELAEAERAALRPADASSAVGHARAAAADADMVELAAVGREAPGQTEPTGIIYAPTEPRAPFLGAEAGHEQAALADIEAGRIPPGYARLVRAYFDAIRPTPP